MTKSIVWLSLESLRFDRTSLADTDATTTPLLAEIASQSWARSFDRCFAHANWTRTSTTSILTGRYPSAHGVFSVKDTLPSDAQTVPERLSAAGYETVCLAKRAQIDTALSAEERFDEFVPISKQTLHRVAGFRGLLKYLSNIQTHSGGLTTDSQRHSASFLMNEGVRRRISSDREPLFLYVHYNDTHQPYVPPLPYLREAVADLPVSPSEAADIIIDVFDDMFDHMPTAERLSDQQLEIIETLYDAMISYIDTQIASIVEYLRSELDAVIIVTADHGELLGEQNLLAHRLVVNDAVTRVPLLVCGETDLLAYEGQIQHIDVIRTLFEECELDTEGLQGYDLRTDKREYSVIERGGERARNTIEKFHTLYPDFDWDQYHRGHLTAFRDDEYRYERSESHERLYNLPDESTDVGATNPDVVERFHDAHKTFRDRVPVQSAARETEMSPDAKRRLEELGYLVD